ncbi:hypothetical protein HDU98_003614 [Podochytrium sp. JEL0797]|nr:hypothetical protein HDU98_003614 [Podochytrium sp. JEL0797]
MPSFHNLSMQLLGGKGVLNFADLKGKPVLIINVASKCGYTNQYKGLEALYQKHSPQGLVVLGFPCNQFCKQEPGTETEIQQFCSTRFNVSFPLSVKVDVNGANADPVFEYLKKASGTGDVGWNFTKFLVGRDGEPVTRFESNVKPEALEGVIVKSLAGMARL